MQRVRYVLVVFLALSLLALNGEVPAEQATAQEVFELRGDFDLTQFEGEGGTVTANEIALFIPAEGGEVIGQVHLRVEEFPFVLDLDFFSDEPPPYPSCKVTFNLLGTLTGTYNVETSRLNGTAQTTVSIPEFSDCGPEGFGELGESVSDPWEGTFDAALQFAQGTVGAQDPEEPPLEFSAVVVGSSGPEENEQPPAEPGQTEEEGPNPTLTEDEAEQAVLDSFFGHIDVPSDQRANLNQRASRVTDWFLSGLVANGSGDEPTPVQRKAAALMGLAIGGLPRLVSPEGNLFPSFGNRTVRHVLVQLYSKASGWDRDQNRYDAGIADPEAGVALERFIRLVATMDQEARMGGGR